MNRPEGIMPGSQQPEQNMKPATQYPAEFNYHLLRNALNDFSCNIPQLDAAQFRQVERKAHKSFELESLVMASTEAEGVIITEAQLDEAVQQVASRYDDADDFSLDLQSNGLGQQSLRQALYRELLFDSVMQRVAANSLTVTDIDVMLFYEMHRERFETPERRLARHILITINPDFAENSETAALTRMQQIEQKLARRSNRFHKFARLYSECPTAMDGGKLGEVERGQLYPELDSMLFNMQQDQIGPIIQSEMGWHLLWCEKIRPARQIPRSSVKQRIKQTLQERHQRNCQKHWIAELKKKCSVEE